MVFYNHEGREGCEGSIGRLSFFLCAFRVLCGYEKGTVILERRKQRGRENHENIFFVLSCSMEADC
jgi:hypothetical protein